MDRIRKIPIEGLIDKLTELYHLGVDYVDITGAEVLENGENVVLFLYSKAYMNPEFQHQFDMEDNEESKEDNIQTKFSDEDLDELI